ncbi:EAL domain-containing protein [Micromonospora sp. WMMD737]|uniref:EAL domain-containing protein n=1 Tax=Micromonospora sp. WMMD737 TaxID=3404113 RepID=UPI003B9646DF
MPNQRGKWALVTLTCMVVIMAVACLAWAVTRAGRPSSYYLIYPIMGAALMAVGAMCSAPLPQRMPIRITLTPTASLVCAAALPVPWVILCAAVGVVVARIVTRYPRASGLHKAVHNTGMDIVAATAAALVIYLFGVRPGFAEAETDANGLLQLGAGLLVAAVAVFAIQELITGTAVMLATSRPFALVMRNLWRTRLIVAVGEIVTAGVFAVVIGVDKRALIALPAAMLVLHLAVTYRLRIREERRAWEHLAALTDALSARDLDTVLHTAAAGAVGLFGVRAADIEVSGGERLVRADSETGEAGVVYDGPAAEAPDLADDRAVVRHEISRDATGSQGVVRLYLTGRRDVLSVRERSTLQAFAANLSTSLDSVHAYGLLAQDARRHELAATQDPDTRLPNRAALLSCVAAIATAACHVVVVRLENYQFLADAIGRERALALLNELAGRLSYAARDSASAVGRVGDAEFALVMWNLSKDTAYQRACWAVALLRRPVVNEQGGLSVRASAGMTSGPPTQAHHLLDAAERVMWRAIRAGQDRLVAYQAAPVPAASLTRELLDARMAISCEPVVDLNTGHIVMVQSMPRFLYSRHDVFAADEDIYQLIDDENGLQDLARKVIARSLSAATTWREALPRAALIVPVPARALTPKFTESLREMLSGSGVAASSLVLEVAEPHALRDRDIVEQLRHYGIRLLLGNYGSIEGSIEALNAVTWSYLRLHPAYALDAGWRPARSVTRAAVDLSIDLDLAVIAPGIANENEREELAILGCALGSGSLFGGEMFPSQLRNHAQLWQPQALPGRARVLRLHRFG